MISMRGRAGRFGLRSQVLALALGSGVAVLALLSVPVFLTIDADADEEADRAAAQAALALADVVTGGNDDATALQPFLENANDRTRGTTLGVVFADGLTAGTVSDECTTADGRVIDDLRDRQDRGGGDSRSRGRDDEPDEDTTSPGPALPATLVDTGAGRLVRVDALAPSGVVTICASVDGDRARDDVWAIVAVLGVSSLAILGVVAAAGAVLARRIVRPLASSAQAADLLASGDTSARATTAGPPEVRRVSEALNRLATRIDDLLVAERETVADISHRLRTPLTAVRLDVEALPDGDARDRLESSVTELQRSLDAVIRAARHPVRANETADAPTVVADRVQHWSVLAEDEERDVALDLPADGELPVRLAADHLGAAVDALVENVLAHTSVGTALRVRVRPTPVEVVVDVEDAGPGIPEGSAARGRSDRGSTGLGLDIARRAAESSGGRMELETAGDGWNRVRLRFGRVL